MNILDELPSLNNTQTIEEIEQDRMKHNLSKLRHSNYMKSHMTCECGCVLIRSNATKHRRTKKHTLLLNAKSSTTIHYDKLREILKLSLENYKNSSI
jgi:hypothetical protein